MYGTKAKMIFTLYPDKAYIEVKGQLYNRTSLPQTFLWWANPAVPVNDNTQSVFPPDVCAVFDHGKRDVSTFPIATGVYYKHDYGAGVDISRYKNIPVPTSYMCAHSDYDFVGGYDYGVGAGILHIADHHVSPGKKQWTWGCGDFGQAWDRNLTDRNGPYIELMTGMFCDNQPDFSWLKPFEEKTFVQYFMPYKAAGYVKNASTEAVLNLEVKKGQAAITVYTTAVYENARVVLSSGSRTVYERTLTLSPTQVLKDSVPVDVPETALTLAVYENKGRKLLDYTPKPQKIGKIPDPMPPAKQPEEIATVEELYLTGLHIEQYRHATYLPDPYYLEGLKRDPGDIRTNAAYGMLLLRRGLFAESENCFRTAIARMTERNPNPYDSEAYVDLGLSLLYQEREEDAYDAFFKATWTAAQQETAFYFLACIDARRGDMTLALEHIEQSLNRNDHNLKARALRGLLLDSLGRHEEASAWYAQNLELDAFDYTSRIASGDIQGACDMMGGRPSSYIECAIDLAEAGFWRKAVQVLDLCPALSPMIQYHKALYAAHFDAALSEKALKQAAACDPLYCFPNRLEDILALRYAMDHSPTDARAPYYLGCLWYDRRQYERAISEWEKSMELDPGFPTVWRNLALAYFNKQHDPKLARTCLEKAYALDESDARVLLELDQLYHKLGLPVKARFAFLDGHRDVVFRRDDLTVEYVTMLNLMGRYQEALDLIMARRFHPWEGGEGKVTTQYAISLTQMGRIALGQGDAARAKELLTRALVFPHNLGEGKLEGAKDSNIHYYLGLAERMLGHEEEALRHLELAAAGTGEPSGMMFYNDQPADMILYQGLANRALGREEKAASRFHKLISFGQKHYYDDVKIDYFAVSLPDLQLFDEDLTLRNRAHCEYLIALGSYGLGDKARARKCYDAVLGIDCAHQGAVIHSLLLD
jgi:tetratricopeptide (TPR) repeat protein